MCRDPIIVRNSQIPSLVSWVITVYAITLFPFIFIRDDGDEVTIRHETIHHQQYAELFIGGFLLLYLADWLAGVIKYRDTEKAYYRIRFEQEAYANHRDENYLENRAPYSWRKYKI